MKTTSMRVCRVAVMFAVAGGAATGCLTSGSGRAPLEDTGGFSGGGVGGIGQGANVSSTGGAPLGNGGITQGGGVTGRGGVIVGNGGVIVGNGGVIVGNGGIQQNTGGATGGAPPQGGNGGVVVDSGGGGPADECNPVNGFGCLTFGAGCEPDAVTGKFECVPAPNTLTLCQGCDPVQGLRCAAGLHCHHGQCARYCCDGESDCGVGVCDKTEFSAWGVGVCVTTTEGTTPVCSGTSWGTTLPYSGSCFVQTGPVVSKQPYETCVTDSDCAPNQGTLPARCLYGACRGICAGQTGPIGPCPTPSASLASGVTVECLNAEVLGLPCCRTMSVCTLACTTSSTCPPGTDCYGGHCLAWDPG